VGLTSNQSTTLQIDSTFIGKINFQQIITHHWHTHVAGGVSHVIHFHGFKRMMMLVNDSSEYGCLHKGF
jgi:hypothetical protein